MARLFPELLLAQGHPAGRLQVLGVGAASSGTVPKENHGEVCSEQRSECPLVQRWPQPSLGRREI